MCSALDLSKVNQAASVLWQASIKPRDIGHIVVGHHPMAAQASNYLRQIGMIFGLVKIQIKGLTLCELRWIYVNQRARGQGLVPLFQAFSGVKAGKANHRSVGTNSLDLADKLSSIEPTIQCVVSCLP